MTFLRVGAAPEWTQDALVAVQTVAQMFAQRKRMFAGAFTPVFRRFCAPDEPVTLAASRW